jgi:hypothetical protein
MPSYVNPATMMGGNIDPKSPFAGALAGIQGAYATKMGDQQIRDTDQGFLANLHKYEQDLKDDPLNDAKRAFELEQLTSGKAQQAIDQKLENTATDIAGKKQQQLSTETEEKGKWLVNFAQYADQYLGLDPMKGTDHQLWQEQVQEASKQGIKLPSWPTPQAMDKVKSTAAAYVNSAKQQNKIAEIKTTAQATADQHARPDVTTSVAGQQKLIQDRGAIQTEIAEIRATADKEKEEIKAAARGSQKTVIASMIDNVKVAINQDLQRDGKLSPATERAAVSAATIMADDLLKDDNIYQLMALQPSKAEETKSYRNRKIDEVLSNMPGMAASSGKIVSTPAKPGTTDDFEARMQAALKKNPGATREQIMEALKKKGAK